MEQRRGSDGVEEWVRWSRGEGQMEQRRGSDGAEEWVRWSRGCRGGSNGDIINSMINNCKWPTATTTHSLSELRVNPTVILCVCFSMHITKLDFPEPEVHFSPPVSGLDLSVSGLSMALTGDWSTHLGAIHDGGTFDMAIFDLSLRSFLGLDRDSSGHPSVSSVYCEVDIQTVNMQFYGGARYTHVCPCVENAIQSLERHLQAINSTAISYFHCCQGEFYSPESHRDPPFVAPPFSLPVQSTYMLSVGVSEYTANSASFAYYISGHLQALINDSMIPSYCPIRLNTSSMGRFIPQLSQMYPDLLMVLQVYARQTPLFTFQPGFVKLDLLSAIKAFVVQANSTLTPVFKLRIIHLTKKSALFFSFTLSLDSSEIGLFKVNYNKQIKYKLHYVIFFF
uniref:Bactericidal permeability-increasing protein n=1 Tax=Periophthalmus magnuspinnatus TaxID=409849 RepID=A0A3B4B6G9_9GOBI